MRRLAWACALLVALVAPADARRIWGGWWRNTPTVLATTSTSTTSTSTSTSSTSTSTSTTSTSSSTSSTSTSSTSTSSTSTSSTSTSTSSTTTSTGVVATTTSSSLNTTSSTSTSSTSTTSTSSTSTSSTSTSSTSTSTSSTTTLNGAAPTDYSGSCIAWWDFEETSGATALNAAGTTCGTDCNLGDSSTVDRDTTNFVTGAKGIVFQAAAEKLSCADATCDELRCVGNCTFGGWIRPTSDSTMRLMMKNTATPGYLLTRSSTNDNYSCFIGDGTNQTTNMANGSAPINEWHHAVCRLNDTSNTQQGFVDGAASGSSATQGGVATGTAEYRLGDPTLPPVGNEDEMFVCNQGATMTDAHICRICSCGVNGVACLCDSATPSTYAACTVDADCQKFSAQGRCDTTSNTCQGRNHSTTPGCGACTLPACNAAAP